jgi:hypothetical protein
MCAMQMEPEPRHEEEGSSSYTYSTSGPQGEEESSSRYAEDIPDPYYLDYSRGEYADRDREDYFDYSRGEVMSAPADPDREDYLGATAEERASNLATAMIGTGVNEESATEVASYLEPEIVLSDVATDVDRFTDQYNYCRYNNLHIPCLEDGDSEPLPVNLAGILHSSVDPTVYQDPDLIVLLLNKLTEQVGGLAELSHLTVGQYAPGDAKGFFGERLRRFLIPRCRSRQPEVRMPGHDKGLRFKVHTQTSGLRVHYTPAYWHDSNQVFGSPTSPVEGWIMPGRYRFGAASKSHRLRFDKGEYLIPPLEEAYLQI